MAIHKKNQATVSQKHTKDFSRLSYEEDDMVSREHNLSAASQVVEITACKGGIEDPVGTFGPSVSGCIISKTCGSI